MSLATSSLSKQQLPPLPRVSDQNSNLEDITLQSSLSRKPTLRNYSKPVPIHTNTSSHTPSPLKSQLSRSHSTNSNASAKTSSSNSSANNSSSQYMVHVDKTPNNLTPSQRLKLRKDQLNQSIAQFKQPSPIPTQSLKSHYGDDDDQDEEEIDDDIAIFNVPLSQPLTSLHNKEKFTFGSNDRIFSMTGSESTRASSLLSDQSESSDDAVMDNGNGNNIHSLKNSSNEIMTRHYPQSWSRNTSSMHSTSSFLSQHDINDLRLSQDALELTLLFNQNESIQINEESRQRRKFIHNFKKNNGSGGFTSPASPLTESFSSLTSNASSGPQQHQKTSKSLRYARSVSDLINKPPIYQQAKASASNPSLANLSSSSSPPPPPQPQSPNSYTSFTRPTWLPPKSTHDKIKHQKQSESILNQALIDETKRQSQALNHLNHLKQLQQKDLYKWQNDFVPQASDASNAGKADPLSYIKIDSKHLKDMYWRGIPQAVRTQVWWVQINGSTKPIPSYWDQCETFVSEIHQLDELLYEHDCSLESPESLPMSVFNYIEAHPDIMEHKALYDRIVTDLSDTYPEVKYFQNKDVLYQLQTIIIAFILHMNNLVKKPISCSESLVTTYYFTGLNNLAALLFYQFRDSHMTFTSLCNMFTQNQTLNVLLNYQMETHELSRSILGDLFQDVFINKFEQVFHDKLNRLWCHFKVIKLSSLDYLPNLLMSLFSNLFNFETSSHVLDVWVFEHDEALLKVLLGMLNKVSYKLFGTKQEVIDTLGEQNRKILNGGVVGDIYKYLNIGYDYEFMQSVRNI